MAMIRFVGQQETRLQEALLKVYLNSNAFEELLTRVGKSFAELAILGSNYRQNVLAVVKEAAATDWLLPLIEKARADVPTDPELKRLEQEFAAVAPPEGMDFFDMCRLSGGHIMIDRKDLRKALRDLSNPVGKRILVVKGDRKTGKSHSLQLISYLNQMLEQFILVAVDLEALKLMSGTTKPIDPMYLAERIIEQLPGSFDLPEPPTDAQWSNWVLKFCAEFQKYGLRNPQEHWIAIDSFNNVPMEQAAFDLVKELARRINVNLHRFRLVLIGYTESLPSSVLPHVAEESIEPIGETHLIEFFYQASQQSRMPLDEQQLGNALQRLFDQLDPSQSDFLERLGPLVSEELTKVFTPGGANG